MSARDLLRVMSRLVSADDLSRPRKIEEALGIRIGSAEWTAGDQAGARISGWLAPSPEEPLRTLDGLRPPPRLSYFYRTTEDPGFSRTPIARLVLTLSAAPCLTLVVALDELGGRQRPSAGGWTVAIWRMRRNLARLSGLDVIRPTEAQWQRLTTTSASWLAMRAGIPDGNAVELYFPQLDDDTHEPCATGAVLTKVTKS